MVKKTLATCVVSTLVLVAILIFGCATTSQTTEAEEKATVETTATKAEISAKTADTAKTVAATKADDSWIESPSAKVGKKVIFTDCRVDEGRDLQGGPPIYKNRKVPSSMTSGQSKRSGDAAAPQAMAESAMVEEAPRVSTEAPKVSDKPKQQENFIYLSNDDSMSLSSPQRIEYAIRHFLPIPAEHIRPHEFLNYYKFDREAVKKGEIFSAKAELAHGLMRDQSTLALSIQGQTISKEERQTAVITFVVDQSGSMNSDNRMTYLKKGLARVYNEFKEGDVINVVQFNHRVCTPLEGFVVGRDDKELFDKTVDYLRSTGSTNLHDGLVKGYDLASNYHEKTKNNRVIMITDAMANTGVVNDQLSSTVTKHYDAKQIAFSGIGVGHHFNDRMLNQLSEKGKGAYLFLSSESVIEKVFGDKFISLLEVVARDVHFKLTMPDSLKMDVFYGEESSKVKEEVQAIHYFANSSQLFLSDLKGEAKENDLLKLDVEYSEPQSGAAKTQHFEWKAGDIFQKSWNTIEKARLILLFTDLLAETNQYTHEHWNCKVYPCYRTMYRPVPIQPRPRIIFGMEIDRALKTCQHYAEKMQETAAKIKGDAEVQYLLDLQSQYCARYQQANKRR